MVPPMATYSNLSHLMGEHRDLLILRTFSDLSVKNLLFYQAELVHLEHELEEIKKEDQSCNDLPRKEHALNWKSLSMTGDSCCEDLPLPLAHAGDKKVKRFHFGEIIGRLPYMRLGQ